jgi:predicted molibdopterin-dependent oxidoreductase YjgC
MINLNMITEALPEVDTVSLKEARALIYLLLQTTITWNKACYHEMMTISATCQIIVMIDEDGKIHQK